MKRGACLVAAFLLAGVYAGAAANIGVLFLLSFCLIVAAGCFWAISRRARGAFFLAAALAFLLGAGNSLVRGDVSLKRLYPYLDEYVDVRAEVAELVKTEEGKVTLEAKITELSFLKKHISPNETIRLTCRQGGEELREGDVFTARIRMSLPMEARNEDGFDYAQYLKTKNIFFTGYVDADSLTPEGRKSFGPMDYLKALRARCGALIDRVLTKETAPVLKAILLGDKSGLDDATRQRFSRSGLSHITAVSGLHVSVLLVLVLTLFRVFRVQRRKAGLAALAVIAFFVLLTGASVSAVRAGIMAFMVIIAETLYRKSDPYTALSVAAAVIVLIQPYAAFDVSFLLSFGAVLGILLFSERLERALWRLLRRGEKKAKRGAVAEKLVSIFCTTLAAQLVSFPILCYFFQEFTFWCFLTNLLVLPILPAVMASGLLLCALGLLWEPLAVVAGGIAYLGLLWIGAVVRFFGELDFGYLTFGRITPFFVFFYGLLLVLLYFLLGEKRERAKAWIPAGSAAVLLVLLAVNGFQAGNEARVMFINVGQGDCSCISLPHGIDILIDAGGTYSYQDYYDIGANTVRPYLLRQGVTDLEFVVASHGHDDHVQGLISILRDMEVGELLVPIGFGATEPGAELLEMATERRRPCAGACRGRYRHSCGGCGAARFDADRGVGGAAFAG